MAHDYTTEFIDAKGVRRCSPARLERLTVCVRGPSFPHYHAEKLIPFLKRKLSSELADLIVEKFRPAMVTNPDTRIFQMSLECEIAMGDGGFQAAQEQAIEDAKAHMRRSMGEFVGLDPMLEAAAIDPGEM